MARRQPVRFGPFLMDLDSGELRRQGELVSLRPLPTRALEFLVRHPGRLLSREEIRKELWGGTSVEWGNGIHQVIRQVRRALGEFGHLYVETVPRRGYRFRAPVEDAAPAPRPSLLRSRSARLYAAGFATPLFALLLLLILCTVLAG